MIVSLEEMKQYLRVDFDDDDALLEHLIEAGENLCMDIARMDDKDKFAEEKNTRIAVMYAVAYQYDTGKMQIIMHWCFLYSRNIHLSIHSCDCQWHPRSRHSSEM